MTDEAQAILKMIEEVSPDDTAKLEEIDARVFCFIHDLGPLTYVGHRFDAVRMSVQVKFLFPDGSKGAENIVKFTRDRNALKAIRPEGWRFNYARVDGGWTVRGHKDLGVKGMARIVTVFHTEEELAELHAIIQAIAHERKSK